MYKLKFYQATFTLACSLAVINAGAQPNITASTGGANTLATDGTCNTCTTNITSLNVDMVEVLTTTFGNQPDCAWGSGSDNYIWAAGYSGVNNTCVTNYAGITVGIPAITGTQVVQPLPWSGSAQAGNPVDHVDVAVGVFRDESIYNPAINRYFVLAVYESMGEIFLEHYNIDITGVSTFTVDVAKIGTTPFSNNPSQLSSSGGTARYPHIDLIYKDDYPAAGGVHYVIGYVVTWHQGPAGSEEIYGVDGPISVNPNNNPPPPNTPFYIADGKFPDVVGVTAANGWGSTDPSMVYVSYLTRNGDEVHLSDWVYNTTTVNNYGAISATTTNFNEFHYPRIAGPQFFNFSSTPVNDPVCVVAVTENDAASRYKVNTYAYHDPLGSPSVVTVVDASDYNSNGFNGAGYEAMKPVITGVGNIVSSFYWGSAAAYTDYPTVFYSDYNYWTSPGSFTNSGDFYAFGTEVANTATPAVTLNGGTDYWEVNPFEVQVAAPFDMTTNQPYVAAATTNNSGYNLFVAWYGGDRIYRRVNNAGTPYAFKPGKPSGIQQVNDIGYAVYPNPVTARLNVIHAAGADYAIMDVIGRTVSTGMLSGNNVSIDASGLAAGVYMLQLSKDGYTEQVKFIKQ